MIMNKSILLIGARASGPISGEAALFLPGEEIGGADVEPIWEG